MSDAAAGDGMLLADIPDGGYVDTMIGECPVLVARIAGEAFAIEDLCSHADSPLRGGRMRAGRIMCPLHGATFDIRTGRAIGGGFAPHGIRTFRTSIVDGRVAIDPEPIEGIER